MRFVLSSQGEVSESTAAIKETHSTRDPKWPEYDPSHGYEPYWQHGDWILEPEKWLTTLSRKTKSTTTTTPDIDFTTTPTTTTTTTKKWTVCEADCEPFLIAVGPVCTRVRLISPDYVPKGCKVRKTGLLPPFRTWAHCYGYEFDDYTELFYTFDNYCRFLHSQCQTSQDTLHYVFLHTGKCLTPQGEVYKLPYEDVDQQDNFWPWWSTVPNPLYTRASEYLQKWSSDLKIYERQEQFLAGLHSATYGLLFTTNRTKEERKLKQKRRRRTRYGIQG